MSGIERLAEAVNGAEREGRELEQRVAATRTPATVFEVEEGRYRLSVPSAGVVIEADLLRRESHQLKCELQVKCALPGARTFDGVLATGDINLSSTQTRERHAKYLAERACTKDDALDWTGWLEEFAQRVLAAERAGQPLVLLGTLARPTPEEALEVDGLPLLPRHPLVLFGDGGTAKSYLALYVAGRLAEKGLTVALFDWELEAPDHRERLERLFPKMPHILYTRCTRPLVYEVEGLRRAVRKDGVDFVVFDSVVFGCDGPPEAAEVASRYFQSLRQLGPIGSLHVAHVTKAADGGDQKPFGSAFWHNGFRSSWNVKLSEPVPGDRSISVALHNRKANLGPLRQSVGFELRFDNDRTHVRRIEPRNVPSLASGLSTRERIAMALSNGPMSIPELAEEVGAKQTTIRKTVERERSKGQFQLLNGMVSKP